MATGQRASAYDVAKKKIDGEISSTTQVGQNPNQPNEDFIQSLNIRTTGVMNGKSDKAREKAYIRNSNESLAGNVGSAANRLFEDQGKGNPLPEIFADKVKQADFERQFKKVWNHRIEDIEKPPADANPADYVLAPQFRDRYRDRIKEDIFPQLFDMIELRTTEETASPAAGGRRMGSAAAGGFAQSGNKAEQSKGVVDWPDAKNLKNWFHNWNDTPSTLEIMVAQEDLWVYEALLRVIRNTNSTDPKHEKYVSPGTQATARIKAIEALEIGTNAAQSWAASENAVFTFPDGGGAATTTGLAGGRVTATAQFMGKGMTSGRLFGASALSGRYVNDTGKPVDDLSQDPNKEFRMMPIDMRLMIEQKAIPRLLVECANSSMRIDVRSVRILAEKPAPFDPGGSSTGADTGPATGASPVTAMGRSIQGRGGNFLQHNAGQQPRDGGFGQTASTESSIYSYAGECSNPACPPVLVEIQGIIYIYNPPTTTGPDAGQNVAVGGAPAGVPPPGGAAAPAMPAVPATPAPTPTPAAGTRR